MNEIYLKKRPLIGAFFILKSKYCMALILPNTGEQLALAVLLNKTAQADIVIHLHTNVVSESQTTALSDFTEASEAGYAAITTSGSSWTISTDEDTNITTAEYADLEFSFTENAGLRGYYATLSGLLLWFENFDELYTLGSGGGTLTFTPKVTLD